VGPPSGDVHLLPESKGLSVEISLAFFRIEEVRLGEGCFKLSNKRDLVSFIPH
jgi:hypothetical protein